MPPASVPDVQPTVFDLRGFNLPPFLLGLVTTGLVSAAALYAAATGAGRSVVLWVIGGVLALAFLVGLAVLPALRRPRRLVIDHEGIRVDRDRRKPEFRVAWTELAGVGLIRDDRHRQWKARRHRAAPLENVPPGLVSVMMALELVPTGPDAVRRHPELARAWLLGHKETWRVLLTTGPGEPLPIAGALWRHRPDLWRGERSGPVLLG